MKSQLLRMMLMLLVAVSVAATFFVWVIPTEAVQNWMMQSVQADSYAVYAASEQAKAIWFSARYFLPFLSLLLIVAVYFSEAVAQFLSDSALLFWDQTTVIEQNKPDRNRAILFRLFLFSWFGLGLYHFSAGIWKRFEDWPWYHFRAGSEIMPNISDSNRDVIRYLKEATGENSRILILSDQKLFFLSYYLLPRRLFHVIHPESEFVIPKANQQRQLAAYRFEELDAKTVAEISPDYVLDYFEGTRYLEKDKFSADPRWIQFQQRRYGPGYQPTYNVRLRRYVPEDSSQRHSNKNAEENS